MKNTKYCQITACCWDLRHELLGLILLIIATFLTIATANSFGIIAMFIVGGVLCCHRHFSCCSPHGGSHCHPADECLDTTALDKEDKQHVKKAMGKTKK